MVILQVVSSIFEGLCFLHHRETVPQIEHLVFKKMYITLTHNSISLIKYSDLGFHQYYVIGPSLKE
jgi:hypothetical protein